MPNENEQEQWSIVGIEAPASEKPKPAPPPKEPFKPPDMSLTRKERKAKRLLHLLVTEHGFDLIKNIVKLYNEIQDLKDDMKRINLSWQIQKELLKYCYPVMRPDPDSVDKPGLTVNFNLQSPQEEALKDATHKPFTSGVVEAEWSRCEEEEDED